MKSNESMIISMPPCIQFDVGLPFYAVYGFSVKYLRVVIAHTVLLSYRLL